MNDDKRPELIIEFQWRTQDQTGNQQTLERVQISVDGAEFDESTTRLGEHEAQELFERISSALNQRSLTWAIKQLKAKVCSRRLPVQSIVE